MYNFRQEEFIKFDTKSIDESNQSKMQDESINDLELRDVPTKCQEYEKTIYIAAKIVHIDFEGRSDGESLKQIILALKPRRLLLVRGSAQSTKLVYNFSKVFAESQVFLPTIGQCLNVTSESHIYHVNEHIKLYKIIFNKNIIVILGTFDRCTSFKNQF